jgi:hypothetical protein
VKTGDIVYLVAKGRQNINDEEFAAIARLACQAIDMRGLLEEVYEWHGPGSLGGTRKHESPASYAAMTAQQIDEHWDFSARHLMHKIAKVLV